MSLRSTRPQNYVQDRRSFIDRRPGPTTSFGRLIRSVRRGPGPGVMLDVFIVAFGVGFILGWVDYFISRY